MLAGAGSDRGASHAVFSYAGKSGWILVSSPYAIHEVLRNLPKLPASATAQWLRLRPQLISVDDIVSLDRPAVFAASKDRPILFTALAWADVLLTLDKEDFADLLDSTFYGMPVLTPYGFLRQERTAGRL